MRLNLAFLLLRLELRFFQSLRKCFHWLDLEVDLGRIRRTFILRLFKFFKFLHKNALGDVVLSGFEGVGIIGHSISLLQIHAPAALVVSWLMPRGIEVRCHWRAHVVLYEVRQVGQVVVLRGILHHGDLPIIIRGLNPPRRRIKLIMLLPRLITLIPIMMPHLRPFLRNRRLCLTLMRPHKWLQICILLVILLLKAFLRDLLFEWVDLVEFADGFLIQTIDTLESPLSNSLLVIRKQQASELGALEEVLPMILLLRHR